MFKFGFFESPAEIVDDNKKSVLQWKTAEKIVPSTWELTEDQKKFEIINHCYKNETIKTFSEVDVLVNLMEDDEATNSILKAESDHSDLKTAEYEGGLKIWECTIDLINCLIDEKIDFKNKTVLDLGCGAGILGIHTLLKGALVDFQDYNKEVIESITIPNVILNKEENDIEMCNFYSGDWESLLEDILSKNDVSYDYILTSETIYNPDSYKKLLNIFNQKLKSDGTVYLAAKNYYFGVGGSTREFEKHLSETKVLKSEVWWKTSEGLQREILKINKL